MLPAIRASNQAWRDEHLARLRERDRIQAERRTLATSAVSRGLNAIGATQDERGAVFAVFGIHTSATSSNKR
jgi:hypothetical protein